MKISFEHFKIVLVTLFFVCLVFFILVIAGFRIVMPVDLPIDFDATNTIINFIMALLTIAVIFIAIWVPQLDRLQSSKIELFSHRFEVYNTLCKIIENGFYTEEGKDKESLYETLRKSRFLLNQNDYERLNGIIIDGLVIPIKIETGGNHFKMKVISKKDVLAEINSIFEKYMALSD